MSIILILLMLTTVGIAQPVPQPISQPVSQQGATPAPKLVITETDHELGVVKKSAGATHTFIFRNEGTADLEIRRVAPS
jgi:hypothetical protein